MIRQGTSAVIVLLFMVINAQAMAELRGIRMDLPSLFEQATPSQIVENLASANFNAILCTVHPAVLGDPRFAELLTSAREHNIAVHAVLSTIVAGAISPSLPPRPDMNAVDTSGRLSSEWLCPSKPAVRKQVMSFARQLAALGIDGLQLDYIRFGPPELCHCEVCRDKSRLWLKKHQRSRWEDWRDDVISSLVMEVKQAVKSQRPAILFSCSTWTVGDGQRRTNLTPEGEGYGWRQGQNFSQFRELVDFLRPMLYSCMLGKNPEWIVEMTRLAVMNASGRTVIIPGIALTIEEPWKECQFPPGAMTRIVPKLLDAGAGGVAIFSYQSVFSPRYSKLGYLDEIRHLFSNTAQSQR